MVRIAPRVIVALALTLPVVAASPLRADDRVDVAAAVRALSAPDPSVRRVAAGALGGTYPDGTRAVPALVEARRDEDPWVRDAVERALQAFAESALVQAAKLFATDLAVRAPTSDLAYVSTIRGLNGDILPIALADALRGGDSGAPFWAAPLAMSAKRLGPTYAPACRVVLTWALESPDTRTRLAAAIALGLQADVPAAGASSAPELQGVEDAIAAIVAGKTPPPTDSKRSTLGRPIDVYWMAAGILGNSPLGGPRAAEALRTGATRPVESEMPDAPPNACRDSLRCLARTSPPAREAFRALVRDGEYLRAEDAEALVAARAAEDLLPRLASKKPSDRVLAAAAMARTGAALEALDALVADVRSGDYSPMFSAVALGRAGAVAKLAAPVLDSLWKDSWAARRGATHVSAAWALWRVSPDRTDARDHVVACLDHLGGVSGDPAREEAYEAALRLAESGDSILDVLNEILGKVLLNPERPASDVLLEAIASLGTRASAAGPRIAAILASQTRSLKATAEKLKLPPDADLARRLDAMVKVQEPFATLLHPLIALAAVHALERVATSSPDVDAALAGLDPYAGDALHVALARARRQVALRSRAPR